MLLLSAWLAASMSCRFGHEAGSAPERGSSRQVSDYLADPRVWKTRSAGFIRIALPRRGSLKRMYMAAVSEQKEVRLKSHRRGPR